MLTASVLTASVLTAAAEDRASATAGPASIDPAAAPGSSSPALASEAAATASRGHDVLMTWLEPGDSGGRLRFARFSQETWSEPVTVARGVAILDPADRPTLTVIDTQAVRRTLIARIGDVVARSGDAGRTWTRLPAPTLPFASFAAGDKGGYAFWLRPGENGAAELLGTRVLAGESLLDPRAAGGSGTAAAMTWDGPVVVYRDESPQGVQDIAVVRRQDARWTLPSPVHVERWRPSQKPRSGPQMAALRRRVAVVWYTEAWHRPRLLAAFSDDAGRTFGDPVEIAARDDGRGPLETVSVALDEAGQALVLWKSATGSGDATLLLARASPAGRGEDVVLAEGLPTHPGHVPQIVRAGERAFVTWIENEFGRPTTQRPATGRPATGRPATGGHAQGQPEAARQAKGRVRLVALPIEEIPPLDSGRAGTAAGSAETPPSDSGRIGVGELLPDVELATLDGEKVSLGSLRGRAVLLNLWATWCLPCIAEIPELAGLHEGYASRGLEVVGLNVDGAATADRVPDFVAEREIPYAVWLDPEMRLHDALRVRTLPVTLVLDREGRIVLRRDGTVTAEDPELRKALRRALGGPNPKTRPP